MTTPTRLPMSVTADRLHERLEGLDGLDGPWEDRPAGRARRRWVAVAVAAVLAVLVAVFATRPSALTQQVASPLLGKPAPAVEGRALSGGRFSLEGLRGRWVVVNFFATWCVPCQREHPELVKFADRHAAAGDASIVSVIFQDDADEVRSFFDESGGDWPVVEDPDGETALDYGVTGIPESYLVSPEGVVVRKVIGGVAVDALEALLTEAGLPADGERP